MSERTFPFLRGECILTYKGMSKDNEDRKEHH